MQQLYGFGREAVTLDFATTTQAVLTGAYQTLRLRDLNPLNPIVSARRTCVEISRPPLLSSGNAAPGRFLARLTTKRLFS